MNKPRLRWMCFVVAILCLAQRPSWALTIHDQVFSPNDWVLHDGGGSNLGSISARQIIGGGVTGDSRMTTAVAAGSGQLTYQAEHCKMDISFDPSSQGSIGAIDWELWYKVANSRQYGITKMIACQGDSKYVANSTYFEPQLFGPQWQKGHGSFNASDYTKMRGPGPSHLDFSASAEPIHFGYMDFSPVFLPGPRVDHQVSFFTLDMQVVPRPSEIVQRSIFYNGASLDKHPNDDAIAPDKTPLLPGHTASLANYTSYSRGINGVMVDIDGLPDGVTLSRNDFRFQVGNDDDPSNWSPAPHPTNITVRRGQGVDGADRVTIMWNDNAIQKEWLQVTTLANQDTGLLGPDVFYFGNAVGETGNSTIDAKVNAFDMLGARDNQRNFLDPAPIDFPFDFDRDGRVNAVDMLIARDNSTHYLNALQLITVPGAKVAVPEPSTVTLLAAAATALLAWRWRRRCAVTP